MTKRVKMGRPRLENPMIHTAVVLPPDLVKRLKIDAETHNQGLSTEIRERLLLTYREAADDAETSYLLAAIKKFSDMLTRDLGARWNEDAYALAAFKAGVLAFLSSCQPPGDERIRPDRQQVAGGSDNLPDDPPEVIGRTYARLIEIADDENKDA